MSLNKCLLLFLLLPLSVISAKDLTRQEYINKYAPIAIREMQSYGIPASITMAQGILESNNGNSYLAKEAKNHFGIKCHDWVGPSVTKDDDKRNECFRKYESVLASYEDHSHFLVGRQRYAFLFEYDTDDYKSWAKGLKKAGYATNPKYPQLLIRIIEENQLYLLDQQKGVPDLHVLEEEESEGDEDIFSERDIAKSHIKQLSGALHTTPRGLHYIIINKKTTVEQLARQYDLHVWELYRYNDKKKGDDFNLSIGQRVYLESKLRKAAKGTVPHRVQAGETMYDIAQMYGVRLKALYRLNRMYVGTQPQSGMLIELVKRKDK